MARILVIEDDRVQRFAAVRALQAAGHDVVEAVDGNDGLAMARAAQPELVVCDVRMPGIDGIDLLRWIRGRAELAGIKVIMLTAVTSRDAMLAATDAGCDAYLLKPVDVSELAFQLVRLLGPLRPRRPA